MKRRWVVGFEAEFWSNPALTLTEKGMVGVLSRWCDETLHCDPTMEQICTDAGVAQRTAYYTLQRLHKKGFIGWTPFRDNKGHNRKLYALLPLCKICMVGLGGATVQFPHGSLKKISVKQLPPPKPVKTKWKTGWKITHFPLPQKPAADA